MASQTPIFGNGQQHISGGAFSSQIVRNSRDTTGDKNGTAFEKLKEHVAPRALHNSGERSDPPRCHPGTRADVLDILITWAMPTIYEFPIKWLNGTAGAGKSAIMRTFAILLVERGLLLAGFFFFRSDGRCNTAEYLISTIVYQIYMSIPPLRFWVEHAIESNPLIFTATIATQIQTLIIDPLLHYFYNPNSVIITPFPRIILIDGLDECAGNDTQEAILHAVSRMVQALPIPIAVVFASRPEHQICSAFEQGILTTLSSPTTLDDSFDPDKDIMKFYVDQFNTISSTHPMRRHLVAPWPSGDVIQFLVRNSLGLFIYPPTVIKFVSSTRHHPAQRLQMVLGQVDPGRAEPLLEMHKFLAQIFLKIDPEVLPQTLSVVGIITFTRDGKPGQRSPKFIDSLLGFPPGHTRSCILGLESIFRVTQDESDIHCFETLISAFFFDKSRSGQFFIDRDIVYADIASSCLALFRQPTTVNGDIPPLLLTSYFEAQIRVSLQKATTTDSLHDSILSCDMDRLITFQQPDGVGVSWLAILFLAGLKESRFPDLGSLFKTHFASFRIVVDPMLIGHWLSPGHQFGPPLLFVLFLALTRVSSEKAKLLIESSQSSSNREGSISILPGLVYGETDEGEEEGTLLTAKWRALSFLILETICRPGGLLSDRRGQDACTTLTCNLFRDHGSHRTKLGPPVPWETDPDPWDTIFPFLLNVSLVQDDLIAAVQRVRRSPSDNGANQVSVVVNVAISAYLQRIMSSTDSSQNDRDRQAVHTGSSRSAVGRFFRRRPGRP